VSRPAIPDLLVADPLASTTSAGGVTGFCDAALAHGRVLLEQVRALAAAGDPEVTFDAALGPLDEIQYSLRLIKGLCHVVAEAHPDAATREAARASVRGAEALETEVFLDARVAAVMQRVAAQTPAEALDGPRARLLAHVLRELERNGQGLPPDDQAELRRLNAEIGRLSQEFERNLAEAQGHIEVPASALDGLPAGYVAAHRAQALPSGDVVITTDYPDLFPFVKYAKDRAAARRLYAALDDRAATANVPVLERLLALRERKAHLLGYGSWADYAIEPRMARSPAAVREFLSTLQDAVKAPAARELAEFRAMHAALGGQSDDPLYPPDRYYLEEQVRAAKHGYDSRELAPYFEVTAVKNGLFELTSRLFGLQYRRVDDAPAWDPDVETYDVLGDGRPLGRVLLDLHPRPSKFKHAGAFEIRPAWGPGGARPIAVLLCNLPRPGGDQPALLTHDEVVLLFHEFGHMLHQVLSQSPSATLAGEAVAQDFVEVPSQVFEEWAFRREVLDLFARHHETGAKIPDALFTALTRARRAGVALATQIQLFLAALDLEYHSRPTGFDSTRVLREMFEEHQAFTFLEGTHYQATFLHLISYAAGYYGYQWALALTDDLLTRFQAEGFLNPEVAAHWRRAVLSRGGSDDEAAMVERFLGRASSASAYIDRLQRG
jgi:thimet oligopeptidase